MPKPIVMLAVGISDYAHDEIPDLTVCHEDAKKVVAAFRALAGDGLQDLVLVNSDATKENIKAGIDWLATNTKPESLAVFYYSGHGASFEDDGGDEEDRKEEFLCPHDCGTSIGVQTFIRDDELRQWLAPISAKTTLINILDACHSGTATMAPTGAIAKELPEDLVRRILGGEKLPPSQPKADLPQNQLLLAGCQDFEQSYILPGNANSLFTTYLLQGLSDQTILNVQDLFDFVRNAVEEQIDLAGIQQHPNLLDGTSAAVMLRG